MWSDSRRKGCLGKLLGHESSQVWTCKPGKSSSGGGCCGWSQAVWQVQTEQI